MPELPPTMRLWWIFTPWKYHTRWARFIGSVCMLSVLANVVAFIVGVDSYRYWYCSITLLFLVLIADMVRMQLDNRRYRRTKKVLDLWSQVISGKVRFEDLTPEQQEDINVERSKVYVRRV